MDLDPSQVRSEDDIMLIGPHGPSYPSSRVATSGNYKHRLGCLWTRVQRCTARSDHPNVITPTPCLHHGRWPEVIG